MSKRVSGKTTDMDQLSLTRRGLLGGTATTALVAGAGVGVVGGGVAGLVTTGAVSTAQAQSGGEAHVVGPGQLDEYYGFWSSGQSGELRIIGVFRFGVFFD